MLKKKKVLQELGLIVHKMWYCNYKIYHTSNNLKEPLRIQDAYFSGRTNPINLKEEFSNETKGGYIDFCCLYPHVLKLSHKSSCTHKWKFHLTNFILHAIQNLVLY